MAKEDVMRFTGQVIEILPNAMFRIRLDNDIVVLGVVSGKIRKNQVKILLHDKVDVELTPYDLTRGRVVWRYKS